MTRTHPYQRLALAAAVAAFVSGSSTAYAHCQVPCGIYDEAHRIEAMLEDTATIDKAVKKIAELAGKSDALSLNQATRWIHAKDVHASRIISAISEYFLTQKIKQPKSREAKTWRAYTDKLANHHAVMVAAMKAKQTVDASRVAALRQAVTKLRSHWPHG